LLSLRQKRRQPQKQRREKGQRLRRKIPKEDCHRKGRDPARKRKYTTRDSRDISKNGRHRKGYKR